MINSTPPPDRTPSAQPQMPAAGRRPVGGPGGDSFTSERRAVLQASVQAQPEVRADRVARGRALMSDPGYPSRDVLRGIAAQIIKAEDLTKE